VHLIVVALALVLVGVGIALEGFAMGALAVVPLALATFLGAREDGPAPGP
jgi:hypothetical protein